MLGRTRPSIAQLYIWRYPKLGNLPHVLNSPEYKFANPGFVHDFQLVDVGDLHGRGETSPTPFFYQNLAEAEFVVATFIYMRMIGYVLASRLGWHSKLPSRAYLDSHLLQWPKASHSWCYWKKMWWRKQGFRKTQKDHHCWQISRTTKWLWVRITFDFLIFF